MQTAKECRATNRRRASCSRRRPRKTIPSYVRASADPANSEVRVVPASLFRFGCFRVEIGGMGDDNHPTTAALGHQEIDVPCAKRPIGTVPHFGTSHGPVVIYRRQVGRQITNGHHAVVTMRILIQVREKRGMVVFHLLAAMRYVA